MKQSKQQVIPVHRMNSQSPLNLEFSYMEMTDEYQEIMMKSNKNEIHRDDYYMFLFMEDASAAFTVDFEDIKLESGSVFYIRPGQVHFASSVHQAKGWFLAIDVVLIEGTYRNLFEGLFATQKALLLDSSTISTIRQTSHSLYSATQLKQTEINHRVTLNLANAFIGLIAEQYAQQEHLQHNKSRSTLIANQFKSLLSENFKIIKRPSEYAQTLNYSLSHLNESVKNVTGFPVSYWIHQQVVLEAKRLLYYTNLDVKEIAFKLGYEDHTYFSRLFSKTVGISPNTFRQKFHE